MQPFLTSIPTDSGREAGSPGSINLQVELAIRFAPTWSNRSSRLPTVEIQLKLQLLLGDLTLKDMKVTNLNQLEGCARCPNCQNSNLSRPRLSKSKACGWWQSLPGSLRPVRKMWILCGLVRKILKFQQPEPPNKTKLIANLLRTLEILGRRNMFSYLFGGSHNLHKWIWNYLGKYQSSKPWTLY